KIALCCHNGPSTLALYPLSLHGALPIFDFNGGTIRDAAGNNASSTLNAVGPTTGILVDGLTPSVSSFSPANGSTDVAPNANLVRSEEHTSELQSRENLVCRLLLEKKK